ncbi:MAG: Mrp/NBP35 family ATP-binding protein [Bacillota bacterium]|nr:Mrp/NBP35 family ATP-binding protein [Bacillota bacterium]
MAGKSDKPEVLPPNDLSEIKRVIAIGSGKGGVGKSSVTGLLAVTLARQGKKVGVLDADLTGPSIPKIFGVRERPTGVGESILPVNSRRLDIKLMSMNFLLENEDDPIIWRGPIISGAIRQFWTDVAWGRLDYLLVDLPPGTGDAPLTVMQSLPVNGLIMVTSPQELSLLVVKKMIKMAGIMSLPILGLIENMSYVTCPKCGENLEIFGPSRIESVSAETGLPVLARLPIDPQLAVLEDTGEVEKYEAPALEGVPAALEQRMNLAGHQA